MQRIIVRLLSTSIAASGAALFAAQSAPTRTSSSAKPSAPAVAIVVQPTNDAAKSPSPSASSAKTAPKKEEPEPKIPGTVITRANGTFLGLTLENGNFKLSFYNAKKKPMAPDVARANARWPNPRGVGDNRTVLNPGSDGLSLVGTKTVLPPFNFNVYLTLLPAEGDATQQTSETFTVRFGG